MMCVPRVWARRLYIDIYDTQGAPNGSQVQFAFLLPQGVIKTDPAPLSARYMFDRGDIVSAVTSKLWAYMVRMVDESGKTLAVSCSGDKSAPLAFPLVPQTYKIELILLLQGGETPRTAGAVARRLGCSYGYATQIVRQLRSGSITISGMGEVIRGPLLRTTAITERGEHIFYPTKNAQDAVMRITEHRRALQKEQYTDAVLSQWGQLVLEWGADQAMVRGGGQPATERGSAALNRMVQCLNLSRGVQDTAEYIFGQATKAGLLDKMPPESAAAASVFAAVRRHRVPRSLLELARVSHAGYNEIVRCYNKIRRRLRMRAPPVNPADYVSRIATELGLSGAAQAKAVELIKEVGEVKRDIVGGRKLAGIAAAAVYIAGVIHNERRTQEEVAGVAGVALPTIRNSYMEICELLGIGDMEVGL